MSWNLPKDRIGARGINKVFMSRRFKKNKQLRWYAFSIDSSESLPSVPGCYVFFNFDGTVAYIGSTMCFKQRMRSHRNDARFVGLSDIVKFRPSKKYGDWLMIEARLIRRLKPSLNRYRMEARYA